MAVESKANRSCNYRLSLHLRLNLSAVCTLAVPPEDHSQSAYLWQRTAAQCYWANIILNSSLHGPLHLACLIQSCSTVQSRFTSVLQRQSHHLLHDDCRRTHLWRSGWPTRALWSARGTVFCPASCHSQGWGNSPLTVGHAVSAVKQLISDPPTTHTRSTNDHQYSELRHRM